MIDFGISKLVLAMQLNGFICYIPNSNSLFTQKPKTATYAEA